MHFGNYVHKDSLILTHYQHIIKYIRCLVEHPCCPSVLSFVSSLANTGQLNVYPFDLRVAISAYPQRITSETEDHFSSAVAVRLQRLTH